MGSKECGINPTGLRYSNTGRASDGIDKRYYVFSHLTSVGRALPQGLAQGRSHHRVGEAFSSLQVWAKLLPYSHKNPIHPFKSRHFLVIIHRLFTIGDNLVMNNPTAFRI
ncbi:MAG TPA: hypothetical protein V6C95_22925 [Coleofasciculaceae cyanobacterium]